MASPEVLKSNTDELIDWIIENYPKINKIPIIFERQQNCVTIFHIVHFDIYNNYAAAGLTYGWFYFKKRLLENGYSYILTSTEFHSHNNKYGCVHGAYYLEIKEENYVENKENR